MMQSSVFRGRWMAAHEFAELAPVDIFHREMEEVNLPHHSDALKNFHMLVKKTLTLTKEEAESLWIRLTADDYFKLWVNGRFVGQGPAAGYTFAYYYNEFKLSPIVHEGENEIFLDVYYHCLLYTSCTAAVWITSSRTTPMKLPKAKPIWGTPGARRWC